MKRLHAIWILAIVLALGAGYALPSVRAERGTEIQVVLCLSEKHPEQQFYNLKPTLHQEETAALIPSHYEAPQGDRFLWPSAYQRPPTSFSLI